MAKATCTGVEARAKRDYDQLQRAWKSLGAAQARIKSLRTYSRKYDPRAREKANAALDQADSELRAISGRLQKTFAAVNRCHRRKAGR